MHLYLVAQLVAALVFAIEQHIDGSSIRRIEHAQPPAQLKGQQIAHQGFVTIVVDKRPLLRLAWGIEHQLFLVELDAVRFLGEAAGRIASFTGRTWF